MFKTPSFPQCPNRRCRYLVVDSEICTFTIKHEDLGAIIIKAGSQSSRILKELAERLGAEVISLNDEQYEDILLGNMMEAEKTGTKLA